MKTSLSIRDKILYGLDITQGKGLEIGPLMNPLIRKSQGDVKYVDRADTETIKQWYSRNETIDQDKIVDVDYVWGEKTLSQCTGQNIAFDYCVAAHVIEHVPDLIGWLIEISEVLRDGGIASFSVPDRRYTFDYLRSETVVADLIEAYLRKLKKPSIRHIYDHFANFTEIDIVEAWSEDFDGSQLRPVKEPEKVLKVCRDAQENSKYIDSHCWVFTPQSFIDLMDSLNSMGLLDFRIHQFFDVEHLNFEFVVQLEKLPKDLSRKEKRELFVESLCNIRNHIVTVSFSSYPSGEAQIYFDGGNGFNEDDSVTLDFTLPLRKNTLEFSLPPMPLQKIRFDPIKTPGMFYIYDIKFRYNGIKQITIPLHDLTAGEHLKISQVRKTGFLGVTYRKADDPHVVFTLPRK